MGRKPNIKYMKRFGCVAYVLIKEGERRKFHAKTNKEIFIGYGYNNTYKVYIPKRNRIQCACDVNFDKKRNGGKLLKGKKKEQQATRSDLVFIGLNNRNEKNINESGDYDSDEEGIHEGLSQSDSTHMDNVNKERHDINLQNNVQRVTTMRRTEKPKGTIREAIEVRRHLKREEHNESKIEQSLKRSERVKDKNSAMIVIDEEIPKNVKQARDFGE